MSNCLLVEDLADSVTDDTVSNYFESKKCSGGAPVELVEMDSEERRCYVYFQNHEGSHLLSFDRLPLVWCVCVCVC